MYDDWRRRDLRHDRPLRFHTVSSAEIAGTAHVVFIAVGIVGAVGFTRSGELLGTEGRVLAGILGGASILGALAGAYLNPYISRRLFSILTAVTGGLLLYCQVRDLPSIVAVDASAIRGHFMQDAISPFLATITGVPTIIGALCGWVAAHRVDPDRLELLLGSVLRVGLSTIRVASRPFHYDF